MAVTRARVPAAEVVSRERRVIMVRLLGTMLVGDGIETIRGRGDRGMGVSSPSTLRDRSTMGRFRSASMMRPGPAGHIGTGTQVNTQPGTDSRTKEELTRWPSRELFSDLD